MNPLLYVSRPKLEVKNKPKVIENKLIEQLNEIYLAGKKVICEIKCNKGILNGVIKKENGIIKVITDDEVVDLNPSEIIEINVLRINGL